ncbi:hypothetical protein TNCV_4021291 [Trichonephila clavipes]|nr:hypothetical protein TNCV_4021291 [Trichonephila clavipes]
MAPEEQMQGIEVGETWRQNIFVASSQPPGICSIKVISHRNQNMCWGIIVQKPHVLVRSGRNYLYQLRDKWEICIRAGFFNPTKAF